MKFVDVTNDVAFRKIFGNENRKEVLISFLNAVLLLQNEKKIVSVDILTPYQLPELKGGKVTIVDVKAKDQNNKNYIVEMQIAEVDGFDKRVLYYASKKLFVSNRTRRIVRKIKSYLLYWHIRF